MFFCVSNDSRLNKLLDSNEVKEESSIFNNDKSLKGDVDFQQVASIYYKKSNENRSLSKIEKKIYDIGMKQAESRNIFKILFSIVTWIGLLLCSAINHLPTLPFIPIAFCFLAIFNVTEACIAAKEKMLFLGGRIKNIGILFKNIICYSAPKES